MSEAEDRKGRLNRKLSVIPKLMVLLIGLVVVVAWAGFSFVIAGFGMLRASMFFLKMTGSKDALSWGQLLTCPAAGVIFIGGLVLWGLMVGGGANEEFRQDQLKAKGFAVGEPRRGGAEEDGDSGGG